MDGDDERASSSATPPRHNVSASECLKHIMYSELERDRARELNQWCSGPNLTSTVDRVMEKLSVGEQGDISEETLEHIHRQTNSSRAFRELGGITRRIVSIFACELIGCPGAKSGASPLRTRFDYLFKPALCSTDTMIPVDAMTDDTPIGNRGSYIERPEQASESVSVALRNVGKMARMALTVSDIPSGIASFCGPISSDLIHLSLGNTICRAASDFVCAALVSSARDDVSGLSFGTSRVILGCMPCIRDMIEYSTAPTRTQTDGSLDATSVILSQLRLSSPECFSYPPEWSTDTASTEASISCEYWELVEMAKCRLARRMSYTCTPAVDVCRSTAISAMATRSITTMLLRAIEPLCKFSIALQNMSIPSATRSQQQPQHEIPVGSKIKSRCKTTIYDFAQAWAEARSSEWGVIKNSPLVSDNVVASPCWTEAIQPCTLQQSDQYGCSSGSGNGKKRPDGWLNERRVSFSFDESRPSILASAVASVGGSCQIVPAYTCAISNIACAMTLSKASQIIAATYPSTLSPVFGTSTQIGDSVSDDSGVTKRVIDAFNGPSVLDLVASLISDASNVAARISDRSCELRKTWTTVARARGPLRAVISECAIYADTEAPVISWCTPHSTFGLSTYRSALSACSGAAALRPRANACGDDVIETISEREYCCRVAPTTHSPSSTWAVLDRSGAELSMIKKWVSVPMVSTKDKDDTSQLSSGQSLSDKHIVTSAAAAAAATAVADAATTTVLLQQQPAMYSYTERLKLATELRASERKLIEKEIDGHFVSGTALLAAYDASRLHLSKILGISDAIETTKWGDSGIPHLCQVSVNAQPSLSPTDQPPSAAAVADSAASATSSRVDKGGDAGVATASEANITTPWSSARESSAKSFAAVDCVDGLSWPRRNDQVSPYMLLVRHGTARTECASCGLGIGWTCSGISPEAALPCSCVVRLACAIARACDRASDPELMDRTMTMDTVCALVTGTMPSDAAIDGILAAAVHADCRGPIVASLNPESTARTTLIDAVTYAVHELEIASAECIDDTHVPWRETPRAPLKFSMALMDAREHNRNVMTYEPIGERWIYPSPLLRAADKSSSSRCAQSSCDTGVATSAKIIETSSPSVADASGGNTFPIPPPSVSVFGRAPRARKATKPIKNINVHSERERDCGLVAAFSAARRSQGQTLQRWRIGRFSQVWHMVPVKTCDVKCGICVLESLGASIAAHELATYVASWDAAGCLTPCTDSADHAIAFVRGQDAAYCDVTWGIALAAAILGGSVDDIARAARAGGDMCCTAVALGGARFGGCACCFDASDDVHILTDTDLETAEFGTVPSPELHKEAQIHECHESAKGKVDGGKIPMDAAADAINDDDDTSSIDGASTTFSVTADRLSCECLGNDRDTYTFGALSAILSDGIPSDCILMYPIVANIISCVDVDPCPDDDAVIDMRNAACPWATLAVSAAVWVADAFDALIGNDFVRYSQAQNPTKRVSRAIANDPRVGPVAMCCAYCSRVMTKDKSLHLDTADASADTINDLNIARGISALMRPDTVLRVTGGITEKVAKIVGCEWLVKYIGSERISHEERLENAARSAIWKALTLSAVNALDGLYVPRHYKNIVKDSQDDQVQQQLPTDKASISIGDDDDTIAAVIQRFEITAAAITAVVVSLSSSRYCGSNGDATTTAPFMSATEKPRQVPETLSKPLVPGALSSDATRACRFRAAKTFAETASIRCCAVDDRAWVETPGHAGVPPIRALALSLAIKWGANYKDAITDRRILTRNNVYNSLLEMLSSAEMALGNIAPDRKMDLNLHSTQDQQRSPIIPPGYSTTLDSLVETSTMSGGDLVIAIRACDGKKLLATDTLFVADYPYSSPDICPYVCRGCGSDTWPRRPSSSALCLARRQYQEYSRSCESATAAQQSRQQQQHKIIDGPDDHAWWESEMPPKCSPLLNLIVSMRGGMPTIPGSVSPNTRSRQDSDAPRSHTGGRDSSYLPFENTFDCIGGNVGEMDNQPFQVSTATSIIESAVMMESFLKPN